MARHRQTCGRVSGQCGALLLALIALMGTTASADDFVAQTSFQLQPDAPPIPSPSDSADESLTDAPEPGPEITSDDPFQDDPILDAPILDDPILSDALNLKTRFWIGSEYLCWWIKGNDVPALVTTSPAGTPQSAAGVLPNAQVLFGDGRIDTGMRSGVRTTIGYWLDADHDFGVEASYFTLGNAANRGDFLAQSQGSPILARPFFNTTLGVQDAQLAAYPNALAGTVQTSTSSRLESGGVLLRRTVQRGPLGQIDLTAGYRQLTFNEALGIQENLAAPNPGGLIKEGTTIGVSDSFVTRNNFQGGEVGSSFWFTRGDWTLDGATRLGLGNMHQVLTVNGSTVVTSPSGVSVQSAGGLLALPTNSGQFTRNQFSFLPQLNLNLRRQFLNNIGLTIGYSVLLATNVMRTGDQIDNRVDSTQLPTAVGPVGVATTHPAPLLHENTLWAQGLSLGVEYRR